MSKTKRTNFADEKALGPGFYNPHTIDEAAKDITFKKKVDFGSMEGRKFTMNRHILSPFNDNSYIQNPESWKYQHPEKESSFVSKKQRNNTLDKTSVPVSLSSITQSVQKNQG
jgi:hypothetical protein